MKEKELIEKMISNELTEDEFFKYVEEKMIEDGKFERENVRYMIKLFRDPDFCKKETGYSFHELLLIKDGLTPEEAKYVVENPCIDGPREECDFFRREGKCYGCTNINGFFYWKTGPKEKLKPVKETWNELKKKPVLFVSVNEKCK